MALVYVNPCSIGMGKKKQKEGGRSKETRKGEKKGKNIVDFSLFFLGLSLYILVV
jgi:hypothetical protein